jgi:hypothetical protein
MFAWEKQVARDPNICRSPLALRVAVIIRDRTDWATGRADLDQKYIAGQLNASVRGVQKSGETLLKAYSIVQSWLDAGIPPFAFYRSCGGDRARPAR